MDSESNLIHIMDFPIPRIMQPSTGSAESNGSSGEEAIATPSAFALIREIDKYADKLWKTIVYFVALSLFLLIIVVWAAYGLKPISDWLFFPFFVYASIIVIYFPVAFYNGIGLIGPLRNWRDAVSDLVFEVTFELLPTKGATPLDRILNKISEIYTDVPPYLAKRPAAIERGVGLGKKKSVKWDLVINMNYPRFPSLLNRFSSPEYILVKRIETQRQVEVQELRHIIQGTRNDLKWSSSEVVSMFIVSTCGFSNEALDYAQDVSDEVNFNIELVFELGTRYYLPTKVDEDLHST